MPKTISEVYDTLTLEAQQEVYDFVMYLAQKQEKTLNFLQDKSIKQKKLAALSEFAGSMKETWKDIDPLEFQNLMREERSIE